MNNQKGKFIVIDGTDGSGKATQTNLLINRLKAEGYQVMLADFPQYDTKSAGLVEEYLNGKYGTAKEVGPYRASIFYACDRYDASRQIKKWLNENKVVIANRYVASNMAHQGGKIINKLERKNYFNWIQNLEYKIFEIPKPNINIILHVDAQIAQKLIDNKKSRNYINGAKRDIHEADLQHLRDAEKIYLEIINNRHDFKLIECTQDNKIMSREQIHNQLWQEVIKIINPNQSIQSDSASRERQGKIRVQRLFPIAKLPTRAHKYDAGLDLYSADYYSLMPGERAIIQTGIRMAIPGGYAGLIWDKGGIAKNGIHTMAGVIDSNYRGEILINLINLSHDIYHIAPKQKIAQMLIQKVECPEIIEAELNNDTDRGDGRFGSTGLFD